MLSFRVAAPYSLSSAGVSAAARALRVACCTFAVLAATATGYQVGMQPSNHPAKDGVPNNAFVDTIAIRKCDRRLSQYVTAARLICNMQVQWLCLSLCVLVTCGPVVLLGVCQACGRSESAIKDSKQIRLSLLQKSCRSRLHAQTPDIIIKIMMDSAMQHDAATTRRLRVLEGQLAGPSTVVAPIGRSHTGGVPRAYATATGQPSSYERVHGEVSREPAVWRCIKSVAKERLEEVNYEKSDDGIAKVCFSRLQQQPDLSHHACTVSLSYLQ